MTDSEKLDIIIQRMTGLESRLTSLEEEVGRRLKGMEGEVNKLNNKVKDVKRQMMENTAELKSMDSLVLSEVERVHEIMLQRTDELRKKIG